MARLFYSMSGEGRGHATRVRAITDELRARHQLTLFAPGNAYDLLAPAYAGTDVAVEQIPGLCFYYTRQGKLDHLRTARGNLGYLSRFRQLREEMERRIQVEAADVVLTDFEPALPRAARRRGVPFISLNHQHFLIVNDLSALPAYLRRHAWFMSQVVRRYYSGQALTIVSSFYFPPLRKEFRGRVVQVGPILRPAVLAAPRENGGHLLAYIRKFAPDNLLAAFRSAAMPVRLYGLGEKPADGNISYHRIDEENFLRDLGTCQALVTTAGNQLVGEALYLGKPVLALPERGNYEQYINAFYLREEGGGDWALLEEVTPRTLGEFLSTLDTYRARIDSPRYHGNGLAIAAVEEFLQTLAPKHPNRSTP